MIPLFVFFYFYLSIFKAIKYAVHMGALRNIELNELNEVNEVNEGNEERNPKQENLPSLEDLKITFKFSKGLFGLYLIYLFTILPGCIAMIIDINQKWPLYSLLYPWLFFRLCSAAFPIIFPFLNSSIRFGYKEAIDRFVLRKKKLLIKPKRKPLHVRKKRIFKTKL